jgi:hypothetical protein
LPSDSELTLNYSVVDYNTANSADIEVPLTEEEKSDLYAELASGAETGTAIIEAVMAIVLNNI